MLRSDLYYVNVFFLSLRFVCQSGMRIRNACRSNISTTEVMLIFYCKNKETSLSFTSDENSCTRNGTRLVCCLLIHTPPLILLPSVVLYYTTAHRHTYTYVQLTFLSHLPILSPPQHLLTPHILRCSVFQSVILQSHTHTLPPPHSHHPQPTRPTYLQPRHQLLVVFTNTMFSIIFTLN